MLGLKPFCLFCCLFSTVCFVALSLLVLKYLFCFEVFPLLSWGLSNVYFVSFQPCPCDVQQFSNAMLRSDLKFMPWCQILSLMRCPLLKVQAFSRVTYLGAKSHSLLQTQQRFTLEAFYYLFKGVSLFLETFS